MAGLLSVLRALRRAAARELGSFQGIRTNNFFLFIALLVWAAVVSGVEPESAEPLMLLLGFLLLFPLSSDPLGKIPASRMALWPLDQAARWALRLCSLMLSPVLWFALFIVLKTGQTRLALLFLLGAAGIQAAMMAVRSLIGFVPRADPARYVPGLPGPLRELTRQNTRQMFTVLDTYTALLLSAGGTAYRYFYPNADRAAFPILSLVVALAFSTYAQCLFGLEIRNGLTRYGLLPLRGWQVLLSKDIPYLALLLVMTLPLDPAAGLTFGLAALAVGHHSSVVIAEPQQRWRFTGSRLFPGVVQALSAVAIGFAEARQGWPWLALAAVLYGASVWIYGVVWDRRLR